MLILLVAALSFTTLAAAPVKAQIAPNIELQVQQITDLNNLSESEFMPGETVRVWLQVTNTGGDAQAWVSLIIDGDQTEPYAYNSREAAQDQSLLLAQGGTEYLVFEWTIPLSARPGGQSLLGVVRDYSDWGIVYEDTEPGPATVTLGPAAWLSSQFTLLPISYPYTCYRAHLHAHSTFSDGSKSPQGAYADARAYGLQSFALADHEHLLSLTEWNNLANYAAQASVQGQYIALRGFEWTHTYSAAGAHGSNYGQGHANLLNSANYLKTPDYAPLGRAPTEQEARADLGTFYETVATAVSSDGSPVVAQFNHPSGGLTIWRFSNLEPPWWVEPSLRAAVIDRVALFEIGTGIKTYYGPKWDPGNGLTNEVLFLQALNNGWRVAPTNSEDNHTSVIVATPRRTGLWAAGLSRAAVMEALHSRRIFASDDVNFELCFSADGELMGSVLNPPELSPVTFRVDWRDPDDPLAAIWLVQSPGIEIPLLLDGKNLYEDTLSVAQNAAGGEWYFVKVLQQDGNLIYSAPIWIARTQPMVVEAGPDKAILPGGSTILEGSAANGIEPCTYLWEPAAGLNNFEIAQPTASPEATTSYTLTVTDAVGETSSDTVTVTVATPVAAEAGQDKTIASGGSAILEGSSWGGIPPYTYSWSPTEGLSNAKMPQPLAAPATTTTYTLTVTDALGQTAADSATITVASPVAANAGPDKTIAAGASTMLEGSASGGAPPYTYSWSPAEGLNDPGAPQPSASPLVTTAYTLTVTDALGQTAADSATITVASPVAANAGPDKTIAAGAATVLEGSASGGVPPYTYSWSPIAGLSNPNAAQPTASPAVTTIYTLKVTDSLGQMSSDSVTITVTPATCTLQVSSTPITGAKITVSVPDLNGQQSGTTNFSRVYASGRVVSLKVTSRYLMQGKLRYIFDRWSVNGVNQPQGLLTISMTLSANRQAVAKYLRR